MFHPPKKIIMKKVWDTLFRFMFTCYNKMGAICKRKNIYIIKTSTSARRSKRAKSSFNILTKSWAEYVDEMAVNPTISAYKMLKQKKWKYFHFLSKENNTLEWNEKIHSLIFDGKSINCHAREKRTYNTSAI